jgi:hypothetical protein
MQIGFLSVYLSSLSLKLYVHVLYYTWDNKKCINQHRSIINPISKSFYLFDKKNLFLAFLVISQRSNRNSWFFLLLPYGMSRLLRKRTCAWELRSKLKNFICPTPKKKIENWYLDEFFEEFIDGRWNIYLEQMIYHLCRPISCWLSSLVVEYHLLWTVISYVAWFSADKIQLKQILIWRRWYSSRTNDIHPMETIFIQDRQIWSMMGDSWNNNQPLEMVFNHWGW